MTESNQTPVLLREERLPSLHIPRALEMLPVDAGAEQVGKLRIYSLGLRQLWAQMLFELLTLSIELMTRYET